MGRAEEGAFNRSSVVTMHAWMCSDAAQVDGAQQGCMHARVSASCCMPSPDPKGPLPALSHPADLAENGTISDRRGRVARAGHRAALQLLGTSPELLNKFREKKIDFAAHPTRRTCGAVFSTCSVSGAYDWAADMRATNACAVRAFPAHCNSLSAPNPRLHPLTAHPPLPMSPPPAGNLPSPVLVGGLFLAVVLAVLVA
jgi:hypothetical protein